MNIVKLPQVGVTDPLPYQLSTWCALIAINLVCLCYVIVVMGIVMKARGRAFTKEFMAQFNEQHQEAFGKDAAGGGYPDTGNGRYAEKLGYEQWVKFNNAQRAQHNFLDQFTFYLTMSLISLFAYPWFAAGFTAVYFIGRLAFSLSYAGAGPNARIPGAIIMDLAILATLGLAIASCIKLII